MSSEVEISNLALAQLGDSATVASINPPEGSAQAEHCQRWYPVARDSLLELHDWGFATKRAVLAEVVNTWAQWQYAYAKPSDALKILAVLDADAENDYSVAGAYTAQHFTVETDENGNEVIYTNQVNAIVRYTKLVTDTAKFSPLFRDTLACYLSSYLAGPVLKGDTGINVGRAKKAEAMGMLGRAALSGAQQQRQEVDHMPSWLAVR
jgi:hypothetical protein